MKCLRFSGRFYYIASKSHALKLYCFIFFSKHRKTRKMLMRTFQFGKCFVYLVRKYSWVIKVKRLITFIIYALKKIETQSRQSMTKANVNSSRNNQSFHFQMSRRENGKSIKTLWRKLMFTHWRFSFLSILNHSHPRAKHFDEFFVTGIKKENIFV